MPMTLLQKARAGRSIALANLCHHSARLQPNVVSLERARQRRQDLICRFVSCRTAGMRTESRKIAYAA